MSDQQSDLNPYCPGLNMSSPGFLCVASLGVILLAGCSGDEAGRLDVYEVSGKVTMAGGPVAEAAVIFSPKAGQPVATGRTNSSGEFTLTTYESGDGAAEGEYVVLVSKSAPPETSRSPQEAHDAFVSGTYNPSASHGRGASAGGAGGGATLPEKYGSPGTSNLRVTVTSDGDNHFPLELKP